MPMLFWLPMIFMSAMFELGKPELAPVRQPARNKVRVE
jgi:hypothetical protein